MIKLYGVPASRAARSLWMLAELGVDYENVPVHWADEAKTAEFLAMNPNGRIPTLDDHGTILFESMAINLYLAEKYGRGKLWPESVEDHGRCYQWSLGAMTEVDGVSTGVVLNRTTLPEADRDEAKAKAGEQALQRPLRVLDQVLADRDYLLGSSFSVADLNVCSVVHILPSLGRMDLSAFANLTAWIERCVNRPAQLKLWAEPR